VDYSASRSGTEDRWLLRLMSGIRLASISGLLLLNLRFLFLEIGWASRGEIIAFVLTVAVILPATLYRPFLGPVLSFPLVIIFGLLSPFQLFFCSQALLFPFVAAALIWFVVRLVKDPAVLCEVTPCGWLADCFGLALLGKVILSLASPSLVNGLWAAALIPQDLWMAEFQALNVGFLLANGLLAFQIFAAEMRGRQEQFQTILAIEFCLVGCAAFAQWLFGWPERHDGAITAPFFGVHELGAFAAALFGITIAFVITKQGCRWPLWARIAVLVLAALLVLVSQSKSAWLAAIIMLGFGVLYRFRLAGLVVLLLCLAGGFFLLRKAPERAPEEEQAFAGRAQHFLHLEQWHEQSNNRERLRLYQKAWAFLKDRPLDGVGIGDFRISETEGSRRVIGQMSRTKQNLHDAHNFLLNFGSEMGAPSALLFLAILAVPLSACAKRITQGNADAWILASLLANFGFFFVNLFNSVIAWPYQALFMGQFLAMPFAAKGFASSNAATWTGEWGRAKWKFWAPLLPALLIVGAAPFSVAEDRLIQSRSFGNFHWLWWHDGLEFSIMPEATFRIAPEDNVRALEIIPIKDRPPKKGAKIRVLVDGKEAYFGKLPKTRPLTIPVSSAFPNGSAHVHLLAPAPWEAWRAPAGIGLVEVARIRLLGDDGPIDASELASER